MATTGTTSTTARERANAEAVARMTAADPVLVDVRPAGEVVPGMAPDVILTSGAPMPWERYDGPQRRAILYGAVYEGLAATPDEAERRIREGRIRVEPTHHHGCVGSVAGIYTASMPVFVVENRTHGNRGFCNFYEGASQRRLNYGVYDEDVRRQLKVLEEVLAPVIAHAVQAAGGIPLRPLMRRAIHMGDELHSRNTAATLLFARELFGVLLDHPHPDLDATRALFAFLRDNEYFFLRLSMAAAKTMADAAHGVESASLVTAMTLSCRHFSLRVSGLGEHEWIDGPLPGVEGKLFEGYTEDDLVWMGGESHITETVGLGGFAQAAAFALQRYQGGSAKAMMETNQRMYEIAVAEHPEFHLPVFDYRGTPVGIDVFRVVETGVVPAVDAGLGGKDGGQIGAGVLKPPMECFLGAVQAYRARYG